jgi:hypothetical protein
VRALTQAEAGEWCAAHGIGLDERSLPRLDPAGTRRLDFEIPSDTGQRIAQLHQLFADVPADQELLLYLFSASVRFVWM